MNTKPLQYNPAPTQEKATAVSGWLEEKKAEDVLAIDIAAERAFTDAVLIAGAQSQRHAQGLADFVLEQCRKEGYEFLRMEGYQSGQWILLDLNDLVVNILLRDQRDLYRLEELWPKGRLLHDGRIQAPRPASIE